MDEWHKKTPEEIVVALLIQMTDTNQRYALDEITHEVWADEMRSIDKKLGIFGLSIDRRERFAKR